MKKNTGFLLIELLVASMIITITGVTISNTFSREIKIVKVSSQYNKANTLLSDKLFEIESTLFQITQKETLANLIKIGDFKNNDFKWSYKINELETIPGIYELELIISGLKQERELKVTKWLFLNIEEDEEENGDIEQ